LLIEIENVDNGTPQPQSRLYTVHMMILSLFTTVIILAVVLNSSSNGFQSLVVRMARPAAQDHRPRNALTVFSAIAPLSGNATASSSSSCWVPSNGFRVEEDEDSAADGVEDSSKKAADSASSSSPSVSVHYSTAARLQKKEKKENKIAVILNMNARGVTESTAETVRKVLSSKSNNAGRVFVTRTSQEAMDAVNEIISSSEDDATSSSYKLVIPVGGDGTLTTVINCLVSAIRKQQQQLSSTTTCTVAQAIRQMPVLGYIPLGTGNGVGPVVGCKLKRRFRRRKQKEEIESLFAALQKASESFNAVNDDMDSTASSTIVRLPIMEVTVSNEKKNKNVLCFFAGGACFHVSLLEFACQAFVALLYSNLSFSLFCVCVCAF
jgi:Diacylglycerol kinase catalytic domain/Caspase domain